jgi:hypothetical protein
MVVDVPLFASREVGIVPSTAPNLVLLPGQRNELELNTSLIRRFLLIEPTEPVELTAFIGGRPRVAFAIGEQQHLRVLREMQRLRGYQGCYMLVNRHRPDVALRYPGGVISWPSSGRVSDAETTHRRAVYIDVDSVRPKGISATDAQKREAYEVAAHARTYLERRHGRSCIGFGSSGNGSFMLIAIEPVEPHPEQAKRLGLLLQRLNKRFGTERVKIDAAVSNAARLMPAPGTLKAKGENTAERPHRLTTFSCGADVHRIPLSELIGDYQHA